MNRVFFLSIFLLSSLHLAGCNGQGFTSAETILGRGWADTDYEDAEEQEPLYCYKSIGTVDCYKQPIEGREKQLVSTYPPVDKRPKRGFRALFDNETTDPSGIKMRSLSKSTYDAIPQTSFETPSAQEVNALAEYEETKLGKPLSMK